jgi:hypothetical protein
MKEYKPSDDFVSRVMLRIYVSESSESKKSTFTWEKPVSDVPSHRFLATQRGGRRGF